jgi:tetratricopeptide (TPR) repeat protein
MSPFEAIKYVTSGITLAAFIVASVVWLTRAALSRKQRLIEAAPEAARGALVQAALEGFAVDTSGLTREQKFTLLMTRMQHRADRWAVVLRYLTVVLVTAAIATVVVLVIPLFATFQSRTERRIEEANAVMVSNYQQEMYSDAEKAADTILQLAPKHYRALSVKGSIAVYDGDYHAAVKYFTAALQSAPDNPVIKRNLAYALFSRRSTYTYQ